MSLGRSPHIVDGLSDRVHDRDTTTVRNLGKPDYDTSIFSAHASAAKPFGMTDRAAQRREAFRDFVAKAGGVAAVARRTSVPASTLYSYLDRQKPTNGLSADTIEKITTAYDVSAEDVFGGSRRARQVPVAYYVGAGSEVHAFAESQGPFDFVDAPADASPSTVAGRIEGVSLGRLLDRAVVFWDDVHSPVTSDQFGRLCVVELHDGRVLVKEVQPARTPGLFHLLSETEQPILDVPLRWAAVVTSIKPR